MSAIAPGVFTPTGNRRWVRDLSLRLRVLQTGLRRAASYLDCPSSLPAARNVMGPSGRKSRGSLKSSEQRKSDRASRLSVSWSGHCPGWSRSSVLVDDQIPEFARHGPYDHTFLEF